MAQTAPDSIAAWIADLAQLPDNARTYNPYRRAHLRANLQLYLEWLAPRYNGILIVGEAAGYNGCRHSGIPFTSAPQIRDGVHALFRELGPRLTLHEEASERSAAIVWGLIAAYRRLPVLWNAFPCHPHKPGMPASNRGPTPAELAAGAPYMHRLAQLLQPRHIVGLGRHAQRSAEALFPDREITYIRHPSMGGKPAFIAGLTPLLDAAD